MSRGRPTFTESNRAIALVSSQERSKSKHISVGADNPAFDRASNRARNSGPPAQAVPSELPRQSVVRTWQTTCGRPSTIWGSQSCCSSEGRKSPTLRGGKKFAVRKPLILHLRTRLG